MGDLPAEAVLIATADTRLLAIGTEDIAPSRRLMIASSGPEALDAIAAEPPSLALIDLALPHLDGIEVLRRVALSGLSVPSILLMDHPSASAVMESIQAGALDCIPHPTSAEALARVIQEFFARRERWESAIEPVRSQSVAEQIVGTTPAMLDVFKRVARIAKEDMGVLVTGETGTGKELIARAIHHYSRRRKGTLVSIACGAIPDSLSEAELFGHEKGSYTGADRQRIGRIELGHGGTVFFDEVSELSLHIQKKLLRFLQEREIERVGSSTPIQVDVRVIASTNKDLERLVTELRFREDLFYRLNTARIHLPPLRDRREDIPQLVAHFLQKHRDEAAPHGLKIEPAAVAKLIAFDWPGNVRQLENVVRRAMVDAERGVILEEHIPID